MIIFDHATRCTGEHFTETTRPNGDVKRLCLGCKRYLILYAHKRATVPLATSQAFCEQHPAERPNAGRCLSCALEAAL